VPPAHFCGLVQPPRFLKEPAIVVVARLLGGVFGRLYDLGR
jgi:hypothetical protein